MILFGSCGRGEQMRQQLERLEQDNRNDSVMQNDSLAESLVDYFDHHGTANERMRANYILGRTYFDLGELPRALETYYKAIDCADTTSTDCDFKTLSRIHAQTAMVFQKQVQPRSQLKELREAQYFANMANDSMMVLECYAQESYAYQILHKVDSVIQIKETAAACFAKFNQERRSAQTLGGVITSLIDLGNYQKAKQYINIYEASSGFFDESGNIRRGREIYYYAKGRFYLAINKLDSAELLFRRLLSDSLGLNCNIAGSKGLQQVFSKRNLSDSIAKYANLSYELNDSAYSLSEMENIQKFQASYNYNHNKLLAEKKAREAEHTKSLLLMVLLVVVVSAFVFANKYRSLRKIALDHRLQNAAIARKLRKMAKSSPPQVPSFDDFDKLRKLVEHEIPTFQTVLNSGAHSLSDFEYDVCLLIRIGISPIEISKLKQCSPSHISNIRKRLLLKVFETEGSSELFDDEIRKIGLKPMG